MMVKLKPVELSPTAAAADADTGLSMQPSMHANAAACIQAPMLQLLVAVFCLQALVDATCNHMRGKLIRMHVWTWPVCRLFVSMLS